MNRKERVLAVFFHSSNGTACFFREYITSFYYTLEIRAEMPLRSEIWGYVKEIATALCLIQSRLTVSLLRRERRSFVCLRRFLMPCLSSMTPIPLCIPMRARRSSPEPHQRMCVTIPCGAALHNC